MWGNGNFQGLCSIYYKAKHYNSCINSKAVQQQSCHVTTTQQSNIYAPPLFDWIITVFQHVSHITDTVVPCWQKFKNFITVGIVVIHLQPFTKNHFHFLIAVQSASSKVLFQSPKQMVCCILPYSKCSLINTELMDYETSLTEHDSYSQGLHMASDARHSSLR